MCKKNLQSSPEQSWECRGGLRSAFPNFQEISIFSLNFLPQSHLLQIAAPKIQLLSTGSVPILRVFFPKLQRVGFAASSLSPIPRQLLVPGPKQSGKVLLPPPPRPPPSQKYHSHNIWEQTAMPSDPSQTLPNHCQPTLTSVGPANLSTKLTTCFILTTPPLHPPAPPNTMQTKPSK